MLQLHVTLFSLFNNSSLKTLLVAAVLIVSSFDTTAQIAKNNCKFLGNIISSSAPADFSKYWNQVSPENSGKWGSVEAERDVMVWTELDIAYQYAKSKGFPFKQHAFVWGQQQPEWMSTLSQAEQKEEVEEWIRLYCERYPDTEYIDVVNEPLHAVPSYAAALGGGGATGWDWVIWSFEKAREYCPNAKLILNDYSIISNNAATTDYLEIIELLQERNLIDYIGEQGHFFETTPGATITSNLNRLFQTGLPILISEYDLNLANDTEQKNKFEEQFPLLWGHPGVKGITLWGYRQGQIWRENAYLVRSNNTERPALTWLKSYVASTTTEDFCSITDVEESNAIGVSVYPNPSDNGVFTVESDRPVEISVMDVAGKTLLRIGGTPLQQTRIELSSRPGLYIVNFSNTRGKASRKLIVR